MIKDYIINKYPEFKDKNVKINEYGWANLVLVIDDTYIFRIPRNKINEKQLEIEKIILSKLKEVINISIPNYIYTSDADEEITYVGYKLIQGEFLTLDLLNKLDSNQIEIISEEIGEFLSILHSFPAKKYVNISDDIMKIKERWINFYHEIEAKVYPLLSDNEKEWTKKLFDEFLLEEENFKFVPSLIHGDFSSDHILYDSKGNRLSGVIDFGDIRMCDPAYDIAGLYICYGKSFTEKVLSYYKGDIDKTFYNRINNFYCKRTPFHGIVFGLDTNNKEEIQYSLRWLRKIIHE